MKLSGGKRVNLNGIDENQDHEGMQDGSRKSSGKSLKIEFVVV